jgi:hypothetical protein
MTERERLPDRRGADLVALGSKPNQFDRFRREAAVADCDGQLGRKRPSHAAGFTGCMIGRIAGN